MRRWCAVSFVAVVFGVGSVAHAETLRVPQDFPTIQAAVDAAHSGAKIVVGPGQYYENVSIAKAVELVSVAGPAQTVIDGRQLGAVIVAVGTGAEEVIIEGFTLTNGLHTFQMLNGPGAGQGGGMYLESVDATVRGNVIRGNTGCLGTGLTTFFATATIESNQIIDNRQDPSCFGAQGGGIFFRGDGAHASVIASNLIAGHTIGGGGAGIAVQAAERITIEDNVIRDNRAYQGGGLLMILSGGMVKNNLLERNAAETGGGMSLAPIDTHNHLRVHANVLIDNQATIEGSGIELAVASRDQLRLVRNVVSGSTESVLVRCQTPFDIAPSNELHNAVGATTGGLCDYRP